MSAVSVEIDRPEFVKLSPSLIRALNETARFGETVEKEHISALTRSRAKLVEQRRGLAKRDCCSDRNEGYAERIVSIQAAIEATERAIIDEQKLLVQTTAPSQIEVA